MNNDGLSEDGCSIAIRFHLGQDGCSIAIRFNLGQDGCSMAILFHLKLQKGSSVLALMPYTIDIIVSSCVSRAHNVRILAAGMTQCDKTVRQ